MDKRIDAIKRIWTRYREQIAYLFFGGVTTLVNIGAYFCLHSLMGLDSDLANVIAWILSVLVAYFTNRRWVFRSRTTGLAALREFVAFVGGRVITGLMDQGIMHLAVKVVGPRYIAPAYARLWDNGMKLASNVLVVILNYVFSKLFIFRRKAD